MRPILIACLCLAGCAPTVRLAEGPPSLLPPGMAVAVQPTSSHVTLTGHLVYVDEAILGVYDGRVVRTLRRDEVLSLYQRPGEHPGLSAALGAAAGAALGAWGAGHACNRGDLPSCGTGRYESGSRRGLMQIGGGIVGGVLLALTGQSFDAGARGMDPSDWREIPWPTRQAPVSRNGAGIIDVE